MSREIGSTVYLLVTAAMAVTAIGQARAQAPGAQSGPAGPAPTTAKGGGVEDIVVTAQKRSERLNSVPLTVTAANKATLASLGITDTRDLGKLVTGFTFTQTALATPVYTLRGVGFYDSALAATPAVTVYVDQIPLTYPQLTRNAAFDLERVEVLKGPQGTLFGQNSTGGAVNYIAAKPAKTLKAGFDVTAGNFGTADVDAFVTGPLSDTISGRAYVEHDGQGDWQQSYTRPGDTRGQIDLTKARVLLDWNPDAALHAELGASGWIDKSDTQAPQFIGKTPSLSQLPIFYDYPLAPGNARAADWSPEFPKARNDRFFNVFLRADYRLNDMLKFTSLTSYAHLRADDPIDADGTALAIDNNHSFGSVGTFYQEGRGEITLPTTRIVLGANYERDSVSEFQTDGVVQSASSLSSSLPGLPVVNIAARAGQDVRTVAGFANIEQKISDRLTLQGGVRYTDDKRSYGNCFLDVGGPLATSIASLANFVLRPILGIPGQTVIPPNTCITLDPQLNAGPVSGILHQNNVSFRAGPSYRLTPTTLLYANVSRGYKSGTIPTIFGVTAGEYTPTTQESVLAYEAGFKTGLLNHHLQINADGFYYDYSNKQILGTVIDPLFGPVQRLVNIPKSVIDGGEIEVAAAPIEGLNISVSATYVHSQVTANFFNFNAYGTPINFKGYAFPYTPDWQANANAQYTFPVSPKLNVFVGSNLSYSDSTTGFFGANVPYNPAEPQHTNPQTGQNPTTPIFANGLNLNARTLLDLRAGVETQDGRIRLTAFARNVTNKYYWTTATYYPSDVTVRYAALPTTFGVTLSYRFGGP